MANDRQVIQYLSPAELVGLMNATGAVVVHEAGSSDGKPVIQASVKVVNAETGEQLPGGLPFSVVMFKGPGEPGYSNIAIGTIVPASELKVVLPRDYFNFCNQRFRFTRVFPVDENAFVIQMDLVLKNATREYVKFSFGLWGALFSQMLFELMGRGRESLIAAADAYAQTHADFARQIATTSDMPAAAPVELPANPVEETPIELEVEAILPLESETIVPAGETAVAIDAQTRTADDASAADDSVAEAVAEAAPMEEPADAIAAEGAVSLVEFPAGDSETADAIIDGEPELSIAAGPTASEALPEADLPMAGPETEVAGPEMEIVAQAAELVEEKTTAELDEAEVKDVMPA
jgi:hypothetical protein